MYNAVINAPIGYYDTNGFKAKIIQNGDIYVREQYYDEKRKIINGRMVYKDLKDIPEQYRNILTEMHQDYLKVVSFNLKCNTYNYSFIQNANFQNPQNK